MGDVKLLQVVRGKESTVAADTYTIPGSWPVTVKVKVTGADAVTIWVGGTQEIVNTTGLDVPAGGVALAGEKALFDDVKVGYDGNADDDIDDAGDDLVVSETFGGTTITPTYDDNGNLTFDGTYKYTYDPWNRLVNATLDDTDIVIQEAEFDGLGRRIKKTVTNSGDQDGTVVYLYNRHRIIETRDGSGNLEMQVYHGTRYIDEVVGLRLADFGRVYLHQDANWNVTTMTDLTGRVLDRYWYSPYGQPEVAVQAHPFDYDDDGDVDEQDIAAATSGGDCWGDYSGVCRRLDADADGDIDAADHTAISNYADTLSADTKIQRIPAATHSRLGNPFAHQGLVHDAEIGSYQNRMRQYAPAARRFMQRDPLGTRAPAGDAYNQVLNLYTYNRSGPLRYHDPTGLIPNPMEDYPCWDKPPPFRCSTWVTQEEADNDWLDDLPDCLCDRSFAAADLTWESEGTNEDHPGAAECFRARSNNPASSSGQQCCYSATGALIISGPGAGTPDRTSPLVDKPGHFVDDWLTFKRCSLSQYHRARPPNQGVDNCQPPPRDTLFQEYDLMGLSF